MQSQQGLLMRAGLAGLVLALVTAPVQAAVSLGEVDLRYRMEWVDQDGIEDDALASTARLRVGLNTAEYQGFDAGLMFHGNRVIGERRYHDTVTPQARPVVADPADTGISQAWLRYQQGDQLQARVGRQRLVDDNARFIGNVGFRQLEQTFDAASLSLIPNPDWQLDVQYLDRAHRVFGPNHPDPLQAEADLDSWVVLAGRHFGETRIEFYVHRFKFDDRPASHENRGFRLRGPLAADLSYRLEFARQSGIEDGPLEQSQNYWRAELQQQRGSWRWFVGHERLGGDGDASFQTPLATLHAHNGWADQFLTTPPDGLRDTWLGAATSLGPWRLVGKLHDFRADSGGRDLGQELNLSLGRDVRGPWSTEVKLAWFDGEQGPVDSRKLWWTMAAGW
ncbi:hypothetical protein J2T60_001252 [Natronospira proteinivora]|uniref:Alginate export domain-containing protein n=1 Tax=Natronospira proteinivora TaxID=1807133 RepID=A0ABT1G8B6_9GAMM|nr:alginate export family protein [Natronospira proteinivora]MCP1727287.1 hypothetical protein [Natronospira proteinivora]